MVFTTLPTARPSFYVHLCSGGIDVIAPADGVTLDATTISLLNGDRVAASYARRDVLFCSRDVDALPTS
jgi:hypothetical protein